MSVVIDENRLDLKDSCSLKLGVEQIERPEAQAEQGVKSSAQSQVSSLKARNKQRKRGLYFSLGKFDLQYSLDIRHTASAT